MFDTPLKLDWDGRVLRVSGDVDEYALIELRARLAELVDGGELLAIDVSGVGFLPSAGIGILARARSRAETAGVGLRIVAVEGSPAQRVLEITGVPFVTELPSDSLPSE